METMYLDIMLGDRFYNQITYQYSPLFAIDYEDLMKHIYDKFPSLKNKEFHVIEGKKVFNK